MTKSELKTGMVVTLRNGEMFTVYRNIACSSKNVEPPEGVIVNEKDYYTLDNFNDDLTYYFDAEEYDIVQVSLVYTPYDFSKYTKDAHVPKVIWKRPQVKKKLTIAEIESILGYKVEIVSEK